MTCGIYIITNTITGKHYIGQSIHIEKRIKEHQYKKDKSYIENSIAKYGWDKFKWGILCKCAPEELDTEEVKFIALYNTYHDGYNLTRGGEFKNYGNPMHHLELKKKFIEKRTGYNHSEETKLKISETKNKTGFYGVFKEYDDKLSQGFCYRYENSKKKIRSIDINKLEQKVRKAGFKWTVVNQKLAEQTIKESESCRVSRENKHGTGFFRVILHKDKSAALGYFYRYSYPKEDGSRGYIENNCIENLKDKVISRGLPWVEYDTKNNCIGGRISCLDEWY